jgi:glycosyltransferase involved in cell wall biosynthesis
MNRPLRIAHVAPPLERVPPLAYGGTERIVYELVTELDRRGHEITTFASGDSEVPGRLVPTVPAALRPGGYTGDPMPYFLATMRAVLDRTSDFDLIHSHLEWASLLLARVSPVPVVSTFHGRLDLPWAGEALIDPPTGLVAVSVNQASTHPDVPWTVIHNGLTLTGSPFERRRGDAMCFVGRVAPEKGIVEALEIAKLVGRPIRIAAKVAPIGPERSYFEAVFEPALKAAGHDVEFLGELSQSDRDDLFAESFVSLMPGAWPEPFGLVAIESLACGTPVIARRIGALPEIIRDGVDGFFGDDVTQLAYKVESAADLDRAEIRTSVLQRFSAQRMTDSYEALYRQMLADANVEPAGRDGDSEREPTPLGPRVVPAGEDRRTALTSRA